jgi:hypothetical protein
MHQMLISLTIVVVAILVLSSVLVLASHANPYTDHNHKTITSRSYGMGYNAAIHNVTTSEQMACNKSNLPAPINQSSADCYNGWYAGINVLYPPAKYYRQGYLAGLQNKTFNQACPESILNLTSNLQYDSCSDGQKAGQLVFDRQFSAFKKGFNWGKNDAMIYLVDGSQCDNFTHGSQSQNQSNFLCSEGYDTGYGKIINEHHVYASVLAALHKTLAYRTGYKIGRIWNSTSTMCNRNFTGRDELICYNGWSNARTPALNDPVHCSSNDTATNSCYNMGESDGQELAQKFINVCRELDHFPKPPGVHSKKYVEGWHNGISDENADAANDDGTYGHQCKE